MFSLNNLLCEFVLLSGPLLAETVVCRSRREAE